MQRMSRPPLSGNGAEARPFDRKVRVTDGPFAETKELVGGWATVAPTAQGEECLVSGSEIGFRCGEPVFCGE